MMRSRCTKKASAALLRIARQACEAYVEIAHKIQMTRALDLKGEKLIAVVNSRFSVYLLLPAAPGFPVSAMVGTNGSEVLIVAEIREDLPRSSRLSPKVKRHVAESAAQADGIVVNDVHVVP